MIPYGTKLGNPDGVIGKIWAVGVSSRHPRRRSRGERIASISLPLAQTVRSGNMFGITDGLAGFLKEGVMWILVDSSRIPRLFQLWVSTTCIFSFAVLITASHTSFGMERGGATG